MGRSRTPQHNGVGPCASKFFGPNIDAHNMRQSSQNLLVDQSRWVTFYGVHNAQTYGWSLRDRSSLVTPLRTLIQFSDVHQCWTDLFTVASLLVQLLLDNTSGWDIDSIGMIALIPGWRYVNISWTLWMTVQYCLSRL